MPNRLAKETSPYLLQHAENPVDWFPWGEEALSKARAEDKPILLSIGYSACHWCHVMERESFEDEGTAALMNEGFVSIKVDREERPDLDSIYMRAVQASVGRGGWPLTAFLTPDGRFFFGGTYFPPEARHGMPSFRQLLGAVADAFRNRREEIEDGSNRLLALLKGGSAPEGRPPGPGAHHGGAEVGEGETTPEGRLTRIASPTLDQAARSLAGQFDPIHGGFGPAPKFPQPVTLEFLLHHFDRTGSDEALEMVLATLRSMSRGGMRDHLGGGFHRYSVDDRWLVPHFEKMLYDNGLLARVYLHAFQITGDPELEDIVTSTLDYVLDDLRDPAGGFYSARDADSEGEEGLFYLWRLQEVEAVLGKAEGALFSRAYDVSAAGNFEGRNILHLPRGLDSQARTEGIPEGELASRLGRARAHLRESRSARVHPFRDEKVLVGWNSFVLRALAEAGATLGRVDYLDAARRNAGFLLGSLRREGRLLRSWKDGDARIPAFLEDYAGLGNALLTLYEGCLEPRWLEEAKGLTDQLLTLFWEQEEGLFYDSAKDAEELVIRPREVMDNATPSGTSLAVELLLRASAIFGIDAYRQVAVRTLVREAESLARYPSAFGRLLSALSLSSAPPLEVVLLEGREARGEKATAYVCREFTCSAPLHDAEALRLELELRILALQEGKIGA
ncbi:MAG: thioredoxin domain-containing protein [Gemmatimonadota bacterium]